jgi:hypothetical protein
VTITVKSFAELDRLLERDARDRARRVRSAARATSRKAVPVLKKRIPVAFGELRESAHSESTGRGARTVVDAPHAAPVEVGARPHWIPIEPLLAWVKLRAAQGLLTPRQIGRLPGTTTQAHAITVAGQLRGMEKDGALDVEAPLRIARAIQAKLAETGTPPHWYARDSLPEIMTILDKEVRPALAGKEADEA